MKRNLRMFLCNKRAAEQLWGKLSPVLLFSLRDLTRTHSVSIKRGDLICLSNSWYITHSGLLRVAVRRRCRGIEVEAVPEFCDSTKGRWAFKATAFPFGRERFVGYGDADPSNVSPLVHGAEMRVAETRAVNRALRKAYGIGICSLEEIGSFSKSAESPRDIKKLPAQPVNGNGYGGPRVRDRLCQLIRQHQLDPTLVKAYATDFCAVKTLRDATREQVENFVSHLADWAEKDRNALLCQLNSYARSTEGAA